MVHHLQWPNGHYTWNGKVLNGKALTGLHTALPKDPDEVASYDCTVIICNVNAPGGSNPTSVFAPGSDQGIAMVRLCNELKRHTRAVLVVGGAGRQWGMTDAEGWDTMAVVGVCGGRKALVRASQARESQEQEGDRPRERAETLKERRGLENQRCLGG